MEKEENSTIKLQNLPPPAGVHQGQPVGPPPPPFPSGSSQSPPLHDTPPYPTPPQGAPPIGSPQPILTQPTAQGDIQVNWMPLPQPPPDCPPGLEYLSLIDQLLVHQKVELFEVLTGWETKNRFHVRNTLGQEVYYAVEDNDCCTRNCCGSGRPFDMKIFDNYKNEVIHLYRPLACQHCCFPCCLQSMEVSAPPGTVIGTIQEEWSCCSPTFAIKDTNGDTVLRIEGPLFNMSWCCNDIDFRITTADGSADIGKITKQWSGFLRETLTDADNFGITFPIDLDVKMKAVMLGACFLIDIMFFEKSANPNFI